MSTWWARCQPVLKGTNQKRASQCWRTLWVVRRRSSLLSIPPCSAIARNRFNTRHCVIHGSHQKTKYDHHAPVPNQNSPNITACTARIEEAMARLGALVVAITIDLKFL